jgi:transcriptional regulator NrdR family protein
VPDFKAIEILDVIKNNLDMIVELITEKIKTDKHYEVLLRDKGKPVQSSLTKSDIIKLVQTTIKE